MSPRRRRPTKDDLENENARLRARLDSLDGVEPRPSPTDLLRLVESFADGYILLNDDLTILALNRGAERMFGAAADAMAGRPIGELLPGDALEAHIRHMAAARANGGPVAPRRLSLEGRRAAGERFRVEVTLAPRRYTGPVGWILLLRNLAAMQAVLESLDAVEQRYEALAEVVPVAIFRTDPQGRCIYVSRRWCEMTGFGMLDALGDGWRSVVHPADQERVAAAWEEAVAASAQVQVEERIRKPDGTVIWALVQVIAERDSTGRLLGYVGALTDITAQKRMEDMLRQTEEQFRLLFRENPIPMWVYDQETLFFLEVNDAVVHRYGWTRDEFLRRKITDIRPPEDIPKLLDVVRNRPPGWFRTRAWRHRFKDGTVVPVEIDSHALEFNRREAVLVAVRLPDLPGDRPVPENRS